MLWRVLLCFCRGCSRFLRRVGVVVVMVVAMAVAMAVVAVTVVVAAVAVWWRSLVPR